MIGKTNSQGKTVKWENLNISLLTNQLDHSDLNGAIITVAYGNETITKTWNGSIVTIKVPEYVPYTISVSEVEGYSVPASVNGTAIGGNSQSLTFTYNTEIVSITLSAYNGQGVNGASVTIYEDNRSSEYPWNGTTIKHKVAYGKSYTISVSAVNGLGTPEQQTGTANSLSKSFSFVYTQCVVRFVFDSVLENDPNIEKYYTTMIIDDGEPIIIYNNDEVNITIGQTIRIANSLMNSMSAIDGGLMVYLNGTHHSTRKGFSDESIPVTITEHGENIIKIKYIFIPIKISVTNDDGSPTTTDVTVQTAFCAQAGTSGNTVCTPLETYTYSGSPIYLNITFISSTEDYYIILPDYNVKQKVNNVFESLYTSCESNHNYRINYIQYTVSTIPSIDNGIYIVDSIGYCYSYDTPNPCPDPIGVAVVADNCCFIIGCYKSDERVCWCSEITEDYNTDVPGVPSFTNSARAEIYCEGKTYHDCIATYFRDKANISSDVAALYVDTWSFHYNQMQLSGEILLPHLGSTGEWAIVFDNLTPIQTALTTIGGFTIDSDGGTDYWTSCEYDNTEAWVADFFYEAVGFYSMNKDGSDVKAYVTPFYEIDRTVLRLM